MKPTIECICTTVSCKCAASHIPHVGTRHIYKLDDMPIGIVGGQKVRILPIDCVIHPEKIEFDYPLYLSGGIVLV